MVAFEKTKLLSPGEKETLNFNIRPFYEDNAARLVEAENYVLKVGASSEEVWLKEKFKVKGNMIIENVYKITTPNRAIEVLRP